MQLDLPFLQVSDPAVSPPYRRPPEPPSTPDHRVEFVRMRRAKRYVLRVQPDGTLRVTVPRGGSRREAQEFVEKNRRWIERERRRVREEHAPLQWTAGSQIQLRGEPVTIGVEAGPNGHVIRYGERRVIVQTVDDIRTAVEHDMRELARAELVPRLHELAGTHGLAVRAVSIRNQRSRWGSCARSGRIALNFRLVQMPPDVCDYVLLHELMHLHQQNHSTRFWRLVATVCPHFRESERWLRTKGRALF